MLNKQAVTPPELVDKDELNAILMLIGLTGMIVVGIVMISTPPENASPPHNGFSHQSLPLWNKLLLCSSVFFQGLKNLFNDAITHNQKKTKDKEVEATKFSSSNSDLTLMLLLGTTPISLIFMESESVITLMLLAINAHSIKETYNLGLEYFSFFHSSTSNKNKRCVITTANTPS